MSKNKITITVTGKAGTGKTTMAGLITKLLNEEGFNVDHTPMEKLVDAFYKPAAVERREYDIKNSTVIEVNEVQAPRDPRTVLK